MYLKGLDDAQNIKKMKLLTFLHLAEGRSSLDFGTIQSEIDINEGDIEQFVIDGKSIHNMYRPHVCAPHLQLALNKCQVQRHSIGPRLITMDVM